MEREIFWRMPFARTNRVILRSETNAGWFGHRWLAGVNGLRGSREKEQGWENDVNRQQMAMVQKAMVAPDDFVLRMVYRDRAGTITERMVSPIRFLDARSMLALCLCRENPRRFELERCSSIEVVDANDVLMPVEIKQLEVATSTATEGLATTSATSSAKWNEAVGVA